MKILEKINQLQKFIGNTPIYELNNPDANLFAKLEFNSFMGSIKDRPALYTLKKAIEEGFVNQDTTIIESSSGNFAMGLAGICKCLGLKFVAVVDPYITKEKEKNLGYLAHEIVKVQDQDNTGGYLLSRIAMVQQLLQDRENSFNINQYENLNNYMSYYHTLGIEICNYFDRLDYLFVAVSTGGTVTGLSFRLKEKFPDIKIIAVDIEGSLAMGGYPKKRSISGMGSSRASSFIPISKVDEKIIMPQPQIEEGCMELMNEQMIFAGGSSGAVYAAAKNYLKKINQPDANALIICPDRGHAYIESIYTKQKEKLVKL
jgi:cysteine synthase A